MHYLLDFRDGPLKGQRLDIERRPASITLTFDEGPCVMYVQGRITKRVGEGMILEMAEADYEAPCAGPKRGSVNESEDG